MMIRVKDHTPVQMSPPRHIEEYQLHVSQEVLEGARGTNAGQFLLQLLAAVDFAGQQRRAVVCVGRKQRAGGFRLSVHVPFDQGAPPAVVSLNGKH